MTVPAGPPGMGGRAPVAVPRAGRTWAPGFRSPAVRRPCRIVVLAKAPIAGAVKTRLVPVLGAEGAARVQAALLRQTLETVTAAGVGAVELWCAPHPNHPLFHELATALGLELHRQPAGDLGRRMEWAMHKALARAHRVLLVGSDCVDLSAQDIRQGCAELEQGAAAVLGPAADGGYVLIGLARPGPGLFQDIPWGGEAVLDLTRQRLRQWGWGWRELPVRHDVDRPEDLARISWESQARPPPCDAGTGETR